MNPTPAPARASALSPRPRLDSETLFRHLIRVSQALAGRVDIQAAIQAVSDELAAILPHDHLDVCILRQDHHIAYEAGAHTDWSLNAHPLPIEGSPIRTVLLGQEPYLISGDALADPRFHFAGAFAHPIFHENLQSRLHVPLLVRGEIIGALSASKRARDFYDGRDIAFARHVADVLAPYFYALRTAEDARRLAIEEAEGRVREDALREGALRLTEELERERQRIGMDLHDLTLADLTRLHRRIARLREAGAPSVEGWEGVEAELARTMASLREIIDDARPNILQLFGLADGIEDFLGRALDGSGSGIGWRFADRSAGAADRLTETLRVALFRIVQEAVNNAAHHAEPSLIEVDLRREASALVIEVRDDGIGFASLAQRKRVGGIRNMQTRARLVGAGFQIGRRPDRRGTMVQVRLPLDPRAESTGGLAP
ncbi:GAF domain-containing sensor histidine kinase [Aureimonas ureilytica]|uniref:GAF domain-containing sensor histidine kinase n=1 Tax=Aureimonas ureilytica TaxID=401562 RepID=UPI00035DCE0C|nr:GAF domain-containing protein [Aureimonas ureilytica]